MALGSVVTNAQASGDWVVSTTWDNGVPVWVYGDAAQQSDAVINGGYTVAINTGDAATAYRVPIGDNTNGETGTLNMTGGTLQTDKMLSLGGFLNAASNGTGILNQSGGNILVGANDPGPHYEQLVIGHKGTSHGIYNLSGGTMDAPEGLSIGHAATSSGEMHQTGGAITVGDNADPAQGYFNIGNSGLGTYTMEAGTVTMTTQPFYLGYAATGNGAVVQSGGDIDAVNLILGRLGVGNYSMSGGTLDVSENAWIGSRGGADGTYTLSSAANVDIIGNLNVCAATDDGGATPSGTSGELNLIGDGVTLTVGGNLIATGASVDSSNSSLINFTTSAAGGVSTIGVTGSADVDGAVIDIVESTPLALGTVLDLVSTGIGVSNLAGASVGSTAAGTWTLRLGGMDDKVLQAVKVPEPSCAVLVLIGAIVAHAFRRR
ncbi:MAG: hypothetical protein JW888_08795 [Pirellulales bacterium]|nr:hypothetical protein [Pirellulales bacterium]